MARARRLASVFGGTDLPPAHERTPGTALWDVRIVAVDDPRRVRFRPMPYLSEIQHRRVIEPSGNEVGKLADVAVVPQGQFPAAQWAILATPNGEKVVRWADLAQEIGHFRLRARLESTPDAQLPPEALRLARDLLDKQIVDTHGAKVVRVNDLQLAEHEGQLRLVGADVGLRGLLRRGRGGEKAESAAGAARGPPAAGLQPPDPP